MGKLFFVLLSIALLSCENEVKDCECRDERTNNLDTQINYYEVVDKENCNNWTLGDSLIPVENNNYFHRYKLNCE